MCADITIIRDTSDPAENVFRCLTTNASDVGHIINWTKTCHAGHDSQPTSVTMLNGHTLEISKEFLYPDISTKMPKGMF